MEALVELKNAGNIDHTGLSEYSRLPPLSPFRSSFYMSTICVQLVLCEYWVTKVEDS